MAVNNLLASSYRDPRVEFWSHPERWPMDAPDHVFLGRAVLELGRMRFGAGWADDIPATRWVPELPERLDLYTPTSEIWRGVQVLREISPTYIERCGSSLGAAMLPHPDFPTNLEWVQAVEKVRQEARGSWSRLKPYYVVVFELGQAFLRGDIKCSYRSPRGGEPLPLAWHSWNFEGNWVRFDTCRLNAEDPFKQSPSIDGDWLFADRESFQSYTLQQADSSKTPTADQFAVELLRRRKTPGRKRGPQIDHIARQYFEWSANGTISTELSSREAAKRLYEWAAAIWKNPVDEDHIRRSVAIWRSGPPEPEEVELD